MSSQAPTASPTGPYISLIGSALGVDTSCSVGRTGGGSAQSPSKSLPRENQIGRICGTCGISEVVLRALGKCGLGVAHSVLCDHHFHTESASRRLQNKTVLSSTQGGRLGNIAFMTTQPWSLFATCNLEVASRRIPAPLGWCEGTRMYSPYKLCLCV